MVAVELHIRILYCTSQWHCKERPWRRTINWLQKKKNLANCLRSKKGRRLWTSTGDAVSTILWGSLACTERVFSVVWSGCNENQHPSSLRPWFTLEKHDLPLLAKGQLLPQVEVFKYIGVLWGKYGAQDWCRGGRNVVNVLVYSKERAELKGEPFDVSVDLCFYSHLRSWTLGHDQKDKIPNTSGKNKFLLQGGGALP